MQVHFINPNDINEINSWLNKRDLPSLIDNEIPSLGYIVKNNEQSLSAAFIRVVEGGYAQYDGLVTNPEAKAEDRNSANNLLTAYLIKEAREFGFKALLAYSEDDNTITRARNHGFKILKSQTLMVKDLR